MFTTFPIFTELNLQDREEYESLVQHLPPLSDISFVTLMIWWHKHLKISLLNGNVVVYYKQDNEEDSGLCLAGVNEIDKSIDEILTYLKQENRPPKMIHLPEFVIGGIKDKTKFKIEEEPNYHEYIVPVSNIYPLETALIGQRYKINRFSRELLPVRVEVKTLELKDKQNQNLLLNTALEWHNKFGSPNDTDNYEQQALEVSVRNTANLGLHNVCLYLEGQLSGFVINHLSIDKKYVIGNHMKFRRDVPRIVSFLQYLSAEQANELGASFINFEMDLGIPGLRRHKQDLHPTDYFKKFSITSFE